MHDPHLQKLLPEFVEKIIRNGGLTYDFKKSAYVENKNYWYFPKYPGRTQIVDVEKLSTALEEFINSNSKLLLEPDVVFGMWVNPATHNVYLDINTFAQDKGDALRLANEYSQKQGRAIVSMYNPYQDKTEYIEH